MLLRRAVAESARTVAHGREKWGSWRASGGLPKEVVFGRESTGAYARTKLIYARHSASRDCLGAENRSQDRRPATAETLSAITYLSARRRMVYKCARYEAAAQNGEKDTMLTRTDTFPDIDTLSFRVPDSTLCV